MTLAEHYTFGDGEHVALKLMPCQRGRSVGNPRHEFLNTLHPAGEGFRDIRAIGGGVVRSASFEVLDLNGLDAFASLHGGSLSMFVGVASRTTSTGRDIAACGFLWALFVDLDFKDSSEADARARLGAFQFEFSAVIFTGAGLHGYLFLTEPIDLREEKGVWLARTLLRALATVLGGDMNSAEPARVLRLPGTLNHKYSPPRAVVIEQFDPTRRYDLQTLAAHLPWREADSAAQSSGKQTPAEPLPEVVGDGSRNSALYREGGRLRRLGWEEPEILAALTAINHNRCHPPLPAKEVQTIAAGCAKYDPAANTLPLTEAGDAAFLALQYADEVRYDHRAGRWLVLDDASGIWLPDIDGHVTRLALATMRARQQQSLKIENSDQRKKLADWALRGESRARLTNMLALAQDFEPIADSGENWDVIPHLLGTPTGVVDFRTGVLRRADPQERITMRTSVTYDADAHSDLWLTTLVSIFPEAEERAYLQVALGYTATGAMNLDKWFLPHGPKGRNGKGTILGAVRAALGDYALEVDAATFDRRKEGTPFNLAKLPGKRFVHCAEAGDSTTLHHDRIKQISGGDEVMAGDKHQRAFPFRPVCKLWFSCNTKPKVSDESAAFWARVAVILFAQTFAGREDTSIRDALRQDPQHQRAVLRWLVDGARRYYAQKGLGMMPPAFQLATAEFQLENINLAEFYEASCICGQGCKERASLLWKAYQDWVQDEGLKYPLGSKSFYQQLASRFDVKKEADGKWYLGIQLKTSVSSALLAEVPF